MVSIIGLDSEKVQQLCDAANEEVDEESRVQIANFLCPVRLFSAFSHELVKLVLLVLLIDWISILV